MEIFRLLIAARFVCAITKTNTKFATLLRSYETSYHDPLLGECKIWEACQATSAATTFFEPIVLGPYEQVFADGAVLYNNSIQLVHREAAELWPDRIQDAVLLSIGTGSAPGLPYEGNILNMVEAMKDIVTQTERTANDFALGQSNMTSRGLLYRFNVFHGLADVGLDEYREKAKIADTTHSYLTDGETLKKVKACIDRPAATNGVIAQQSLDGSMSQLLISSAHTLRPPTPKIQTEDRSSRKAIYIGERAYLQGNSCFNAGDEVLIIGEPHPSWWRIQLVNGSAEGVVSKEKVDLRDRPLTPSKPPETYLQSGHSGLPSTSPNKATQRAKFIGKLCGLEGFQCQNGDEMFILGDADGFPDSWRRVRLLKNGVEGQVYLD